MRELHEEGMEAGAGASEAMNPLYQLHIHICHL